MTQDDSEEIQEQPTDSEDELLFQDDEALLDVGKRKKRTWRRNNEKDDEMKSKLLKIIEDPTVGMAKENVKDADDLFLESLAPQLKSLAPMVKERTKIRIQQVLFDARFATPTPPPAPPKPKVMEPNFPEFGYNQGQYNTVQNYDEGGNVLQFAQL